MIPAFIIGSPRSGTTLLEQLLSCHDDIAEWYEPYYLWEKYFDSADDDQWNPEILTEKARKGIRNEFEKFGQKADKAIVLDKSPTHAFNIGIIYQIFPEAKWIHILRDGRDVTLSIKKEWQKRERMVADKNYLQLLRTATDMIRRQPFWRYRLMAVKHEISHSLSANPFKYLNKSKWQGGIGWGPRFEGWHAFLESHSVIEFNAMQWLKSVEGVRKNWHLIPDNHKIEIRYEDLLDSPQLTLNRLISFLSLEVPPNFFRRIPAIKSNNIHKWDKELSRDEIQRIKTILSPLIQQLDYDQSGQW